MKHRLRNRAGLMLIVLATTGVASRGASPMATRQDRPAQPSKHARVSLSIDRGSKLIILNRSGSTTIRGWDRNVVEAEATSQYGPEEINVAEKSEPTRSITLTTLGRAREISLTVNVPRDLELLVVDVARGSVHASGVSGTLKVNSGRGDVTVAKVGPLEINRVYGNVALENVSGSARLHLSSGHLVAKNIAGELSAKGWRVDAQVENVSGEVDLALSDGDFSISNVGGGVKVASAGGDVDIRCVKGRVGVSTARGSITLSGVDGDVDVTTASGDISLAGVLRKGGQYRLRTISGDVRMALEQGDRGFVATLHSYHGKIKTDFPLTLESPASAANRKLVGRFGDGSAAIVLDAYRGGVFLVRAPDGSRTNCR